MCSNYDQCTQIQLIKIIKKRNLTISGRVKGSGMQPFIPAHTALCSTVYLMAKRQFSVVMSLVKVKKEAKIDSRIYFKKKKCESTFLCGSEDKVCVPPCKAESTFLCGSEDKVCVPPCKAEFASLKHYAFCFAHCCWRPVM